MRNAIAYIRVSTPNQLKQGTGLDLQITRIEAYAKEAGWRIVATYKDVQSGFDEDHVASRPGVQGAIKKSRELRCPIIVDGLSRFSRNTATLEKLILEGKPKIISATSGEGASRAVMIGEAKRAQTEVEHIRRTTKEGLQRARERGVVLGNPRLDVAQKMGAAANKDEAAQRARELAPVIEEIMATGLMTKKAIADELNRQGHRTARSGRWTEANVRRVLLRVTGTRETKRGVREVQEDVLAPVYATNPNYGIY